MTGFESRLVRHEEALRSYGAGVPGTDAAGESFVTVWVGSAVEALIGRSESRQHLDCLTYPVYVHVRADAEVPEGAVYRLDLEDADGALYPEAVQNAIMDAATWVEGEPESVDVGELHRVLEAYATWLHQATEPVGRPREHPGVTLPDGRRIAPDLVHGIAALNVRAENVHTGWVVQDQDVPALVGLVADALLEGRAFAPRRATGGIIQGPGTGTLMQLSADDVVGPHPSDRAARLTGD